ncbi:Gti1/Pac2 family-domain-containing protein [Cercophora scortea]|uniref:Gti1/Pac2 family-domain-containing protein n=1 Tax=Cercophora scortea TaxID=314031 RepID=A0AAE0I796_9PEZI|nr:Gti1/Pac2 family-domain-containing protein [Cercophora scortea]
MTMETYHGYVRSPTDAIKLFEACRLGLLPRVQRRLSEKERQAIRSGSVFVWDEREAGMRRWTDGKSWSASRVSGSFLTYREMEGKRGNAFGNRRGAGKTPDSGRGSDEDPEDGEPDGYRYKADGLMKQSFSITTQAGQHLHLISYYTRNQTDLLPSPANDPNLRNIVPAKNLYPESSMNDNAGPALTRAPMQQPPYGQPHHQGPPPHQGQAQHQGYPPQYPQSGYAWPPSPAATPPFNHGHYPSGPSYAQTTLPPPSQHHYASAHPQQQYPQAPTHPGYERSPVSLPPPQQQSAATAPPPKPIMPLPQPYQAQPYQQASHQASHQQVNYPPASYRPPPNPQQVSHQASHQQASHQAPAQQQAVHHQPPHMPQPRMAALDSPRSQQLQAQARQAVMIDPGLAANAPRQSQGPLPALGQPPQQQQQPSQTGASTTVTPPHRAHSSSPPKATLHPRANGTKGGTLSVSDLVHPTPSNSEPSSANPGSNSANSSPRAPHETASIKPTEDKRTIGVLNKKFF